MPTEYGTGANGHSTKRQPDSILQLLEKRRAGTPSKMTFASLLKTSRKAGGLTQSQLAKKLFVGRRTIMRWEKNQRKPTRLERFAVEHILSGGNR